MSLNLVQSASTALKVNNNMLTHWSDFKSIIDKLFVDSMRTLAWLDLSFNDFRTIDGVRLGQAPPPPSPFPTLCFLHDRE